MLVGWVTGNGCIELSIKRFCRVEFDVIYINVFLFNLKIFLEKIYYVFNSKIKIFRTIIFRITRKYLSFFFLLFLRFSFSLYNYWKSWKIEIWLYRSTIYYQKIGWYTCNKSTRSSGGKAVFRKKNMIFVQFKKRSEFKINKWTVVYIFCLEIISVVDRNINRLNLKIIKIFQTL